MISLRVSTLRGWQAMLNRCSSPRDPRYADYGGRGITVCERWKSFTSFIEDMGIRPAWELQLDRIDNNKGYYRENCRWATAAENNANKRPYKKAINNSSGVTGVSFHEGKKNWRAFGGRELLYQGKSRETACRERAAWEASRT